MNTKVYKSRMKPISLIGLMVAVSMILAACTASVQTNQAVAPTTPAVAQPVVAAQRSRSQLGHRPHPGKDPGGW